MTVTVRFGQRLREAREAAGLSVRDVTERAGLPRTYLYALERGDNSPSLDTAQRLADAVGVALADLLTVEKI